MTKLKYYFIIFKKWNQNHLLCVIHLALSLKESTNSMYYASSNGCQMFANIFETIIAKL